MVHYWNRVQCLYWAWVPCLYWVGVLCLYIHIKYYSMSDSSIFVKVHSMAVETQKKEGNKMKCANLKMSTILDRQGRTR